MVRSAHGATPALHGRRDLRRWTDHEVCGLFRSGHGNGAAAADLPSRPAGRGLTERSQALLAQNARGLWRPWRRAIETQDTVWRLGRLPRRRRAICPLQQGARPFIRCAPRSRGASYDPRCCFDTDFRREKYQSFRNRGIPRNDCKGWLGACTWGASSSWPASRRSLGEVDRTG